MSDLPVLDAPAWIAYLIVLAAAVITALDNVGKLLAAHPGYWRYFRTWILYFAYVAIPIVLFWLLDQLNIVEDTSVFAAILVGFAYQQIMTAGVSGVSLPGASAKVWQPFQEYATRLASHIGDQQVAHTQTAADTLGRKLTAAALYQQLFRLVMERTADPAALRKDLDDIDVVNGATTGDADVAQRRKVERLLKELRKVVPEGWEALLRNRGLVSRRENFFLLNNGLSTLVASAVAVLFAGTLAFGVFGFFTDRSQDRYYAWRLMKKNTTGWDQVRAIQYFRAHDPEKLVLHSHVLLPVVGKLAIPELTAENANRILAALVYLRRTDLDSIMVPSLIATLQTASPEARLRIHHTLREIAAGAYPGVPVDSALAAWVPAVGETATSVERRTYAWLQWWRSVEKTKREKESGGQAATVDSITGSS